LLSLDELKAVDPIAINVKELTSFTDYMVVASGTSNRHVTALSEKVIEDLKKINNRDLRIEGSPGDEWLLVDAGEVIVHLMSSEARSFYDLESLWDSDL